MTQDQVRASSTPHARPAAKAVTGPVKAGLLFTAAAAVAIMIGGHAAQAAVYFDDFTPLTATGDTNGSFTVAAGINDSGLIVGSYIDSTSGSTFGFGYNGSTYTQIAGPAGSTYAAATGISNNNKVTGTSQDAGGSHGFVQTGFVGTAMAFDVPGAIGNTNGSGINSAGTVVGFYYDGTTTNHGFVLPGGPTPLDPTGATYSQAMGINDAGKVAGMYTDGGGATHGYVYNGTGFVTLDDPNATQGTVATGIDANGDIVGYYTDGGGVHGFVDMGGSFYTVDEPNANGQTEILGINDLGNFVGFFVDAAGNTIGFEGSVPEPATLSLFGMAMFGLATLRRRRSLAQS